MPIYEYECGACGHRLEALQKISDPLLEDCPECEKPKLRKLISAAAFQLKGTGWYVTDFRDGDKKKKDKKGDGEGAGEEGAGKEESKKGESKTESGAEKKGSDKKDSGKSGGGKKGGDAAASAAA